MRYSPERKEACVITDHATSLACHLMTTLDPRNFGMKQW